MKKKSMFVAFGAAAVMAAGVLAGCGGNAGGDVKETATEAVTDVTDATAVTTAQGDVTVESIAKSASENMKNVKSYALDGGVNMKYGVKAEGQSMDMSVVSKIQGESVLESKNSHITMDMEMKMLGTDYKMTNEAYGLVAEDGKYVTYSKTNNPITGEEEAKWTKNETETAIDFESLNNLDLFNQIADGKIKAELSNETVQINGRDAYKITGTIPGEVFQEVFSSMYGSGENAENVSTLDFSKASADAEIYVYKDSLLPAKAYMDAKSYMETILKESMAGNTSIENIELAIDEFNVETTYDKYNEIDKIEVPADVIKEAEETAALEETDAALEETTATETSQAG